MKYILKSGFFALFMLFTMHTIDCKAQAISSENLEEKDEVIQNYINSKKEVDIEYQNLTAFLDSINKGPLAPTFFISGEYTITEYKSYITDLHEDWQEYTNEQCDKFKEEDSDTTNKGTFYHICKTEMNKQYYYRLSHLLSNLKEELED